MPRLMLSDEFWPKLEKILLQEGEFTTTRDLNENSNGLLRQYFPKGMELVVQWAMDRLNHRPRKVLGFRTLFEIFFGNTVRYTKSP